MIHAAINKPGQQLIVCGNGPTSAWLDWVATCTVPLTPDQFWWRATMLADRGIAPLCAGRVHERCSGRFDPETWDPNPDGPVACVCDCGHVGGGG